LLKQLSEMPLLLQQDVLLPRSHRNQYCMLLSLSLS
jgi:hypothetical protein